AWSFRWACASLTHSEDEGNGVGDPSRHFPLPTSSPTWRVRTFTDWTVFVQPSLRSSPQTIGIIYHSNTPPNHLATSFRHRNWPRDSASGELTSLSHSAPRARHQFLLSRCGLRTSTIHRVPSADPPYYVLLRATTIQFNSA